MTVSHRRWNTDPAVIRAALGWLQSHKHCATAARFGVSESTLRNWKDKAAQAAAEGYEWPTDTDVIAYRRRTPRRDHDRVTRNRRKLRSQSGPLLVRSVGTQRRLRALAALGWRYQDLADRMGVTFARVGHLANGVYDTVHRDVAATVAALYDDLGGSFGPSDRSRKIAASRGWAPPIAWDDEKIDDPNGRPNFTGDQAAVFDEIAVQRAMHGDDVHLRPAERTEVARRLTALGYSAGEIAERMHTTKRSVVRRRAAGRRSA